MVITWNTRDDTRASVVEYGIGGLILRALGTYQEFVDGGSQQRSQFIHTVRLKDLQPGQEYGKIN